ncbi:arylsulfatase [Subtercola sp. YIM 133946]|uniref:arylsulfatase n=1 Tax=Subtercola sp. YIM 133946 TaxID=3118909 RepID=UPI002F93449C
MSDLSEPARPAGHPNVVFLVADNIGWGDIGCYGGTAPTPRIDQLAAEGLRFKNYNTEAQCTPTRAALLTGRLPIRTGNCSIPLPGQGDYGLVQWEYTLGNLFSDAGYATAAYGKWHVGETAGRLPTDQGFDEWRYGIKNTSDEALYTQHPLFAESGFEIPQIWEGVAGSELTPVSDFTTETRPYLDENITNATVEFIERNAATGTPFFTYVGFTQIHPPVLNHPDFTGKSGGGVYSDTLAELDFRTGQILDALERAGVAENTIVVWTSDNPAARGIPAGGSNGPWRGHFGSGFEGGMRAPGMVRWPGRIAPGITDEIVTAVEWFPTLANLINESARIPADRPIDGVDTSAFLLGEQPTSGRDHVIYYGSDAELMSVKWRTMKVVFRYTESTSGPFIKPQWPFIFDLIDDPSEEWDLVQKQLQGAWVIAPIARRLGALAHSMAEYPNIEPGREFTGY